MSKADDKDLERHQLALVHWQQHAMETDQKVLIIFEGRDAAGKDGAIRAVTEHLSVRNTKIVAVAKPSDRETSQWFFQRYVGHLPSCGETVIFNRSWYNRAGVERVMGFSSPEQQEVFLRDVPVFETMLLEGDLRIVKFWLDVSKKEQAVRLKDRRTDPLKILKSSPLDAAAQERWDAYSAARDEMLRRTSTPALPWICVRSDHKKAARLNIIRHLVHALAPKEISAQLDEPDSDVLFPFEMTALKDGRLEH
jgi:polyphosphate kinase 2